MMHILLTTFAILYLFITGIVIAVLVAIAFGYWKKHERVRLHTSYWDYVNSQRHHVP
jgi:hypothetical protein